MKERPDPLLDRIAEELRAEARKHWGEIGKLENRIDRREGYFAKVCGGVWTMPLRVLNEALAILKVEPSVFFGRALDIAPGGETALKELAGRSEPSNGLDRILRAIRRPATTTTTPKKPLPVEPTEELLESIESCPRLERRRRIASVRKYKNPDFVRAYLGRLDVRRFEKAKDVLKLAEAIAIELIPKLTVPTIEKIALQCLALGVFAGTQPALGEPQVAARALHEGIEIARQHALPQETATLLIQGAGLLRDQRQPRRALALLREAQEIYLDRRQLAETARVMIARAMTLDDVGETRLADSVFRSGLDFLDRAGERRPALRFSACHGLALVRQRLGDLDAAEHWRERALTYVIRPGPLVKVRLAWQRGLLAAERRDFAAAGVCFQKVRQKLARTEEKRALANVTIELAAVELARGRPNEALELIAGLKPLVGSLRSDKAVQNTLPGLIKAGAKGKLTAGLLAQVVDRLRATGGWSWLHFWEPWEGALTAGEGGF